MTKSKGKTMAWYAHGYCVYESSSNAEPDLLICDAKSEDRAKQIAHEHNIHPVLISGIKSARREISDQLWLYEYSHNRYEINRRKLNRDNEVYVKITAVLKLDRQGNTANK